MTRTFIWKEWKEQSRGKGIWLGAALMTASSVVLLLQARSYPTAEGFGAFLLALYDLNVYLLPLLSLFLASFSVFQEKEQKTMVMLLTKKESRVSFLLKKSLAVQSIICLMLIGCYMVMAFPMKLLLVFVPGDFFIFLLSTAGLLLIFNQFGIMLGMICRNRMQLVGANLVMWFSFVFLIDLLLLHYLPFVTQANVKLFSVLYFADPLHTARLLIETSIGSFPLHNLSRFMRELVWIHPIYSLVLDIAILALLSFGIAIWLGRKEEKYD